jgi:hypothetical protein
VDLPRGLSCGGTFGVSFTDRPLPATVLSARLQRGHIGFPAMSTVQFLPPPGQGRSTALSLGCVTADSSFLLVRNCIEL